MEMEQQKTNVVVLYPSPAIGHLISMVEMGKLLLLNHPSLSLHILITTPPYNAGNTAPYIRRVSSAAAAGDGPPITFHHLPTISAPLNPTSSVHHETPAFELLSLNNPNLRQILISLSTNHSIRALFMDFFCPTALSVASDLSIPGYFFLTSGAGFLASFLHLPHFHRTTTKSFKDLNNTTLQIPGLPPIPASDMLKPVQDRSDKAYHWFLTSANQVPLSAGIVVNTYDSLEPRALKALRDGLCVPDGPTPPIFCIGPMIAAEGRREGDGGDECLGWLDSQPSGSVVFLCFGSLGVFSAEQLREIAVGLERSGKRFLWVVRSPPPETEDDRRRTSTPPPEPDLESLLPRGFLERTRERGLVVKSWAPQVAVLSHGSVGGFVTHCGWNSVLEAVRAGVPMVAWPLYAEQRFNRVVLVEEMKLALAMRECEEEGGLVSAAEVGRRVSELMDSEEGVRVRERVLEMREAAKAALSEGGSSRLALSRLVDSLRLI